MSEAERRVSAIAAALAIGVALALASTAPSDHALARATGGAAISLLLASLACSSLASLASPAWALGLRAARRRVGIASALVASLHAAIAFSNYVVPMQLGPILALPWLRQGALALAISWVLAATSFPIVQRVLRVRAWSALHRLVYPAVLLAAAHVLTEPFGSARFGTLVVALTGFLLAVRMFRVFLRRRVRGDD